MKTGFILSLIIAITGSLSANAYYVSPTGKDENKGTKWFMPFKTLQKAATMARPGDTVFILKGDYYSDQESLLHIDRSGSSDGWIVFKNYLNHKPQLHVRGKAGIWIQSASFISIEGLNFVADSIHLKSDQHAAGAAILLEGSYEAPCTHIKIFNNFIRQMPAEGIRADYFDYITISYNKLFNNGSFSSAGILLKNGLDADHQQVYHNYIQANVLEKNSSIPAGCSPAISVEYNPDFLSNSSPRLLIHNNIIYKSGGGGMEFTGAIGVHVINNTLFKNSEREGCREPEIEIRKSSKITVYNNIFYSSTAKPGNSIYNSSDIDFRNNLFYNFSSRDASESELIADPGFEMINESTGNFNFRLKGNSPAINAGLDKLLSDIDYEGNKRLMDTHVDLGAIEFTNRILPSLKDMKAGIQSKGIKTEWSSLYTKDQRVYTLWNQQNRGFSVRIFDSQGNLISEAIRPETSSGASFEMDFNNYPPGFYTINAYTSVSKHTERIRVESKSRPQ